MKVRMDQEGSLHAFEELLLEYSKDPEIQGIFVLGCDGNGWLPTEVDPILAKVHIPLFGGVFPQIIHHQRNYEKGTVIVGLSDSPEILRISNLSNPGEDFEEQIETGTEKWAFDDSSSNYTLIVLVDGLSRGISKLVESLFSYFGLEQNFIGGGAGSLTFQQKPCLFTADGMVEDAALIARLPMPSGVGVAHGWLPISEGMKVTSSDRNVIRTLDWRPAYEVYQELVEAHSKKRFADSEFFDLAKCYPFGIGKLGTEVVVRDPLMIGEDKSLVCVGEVPQGCFVKLLHGSPESLIQAAGEARSRALQSRPLSQAAEAEMLIDCISRVLFLEDRIKEEMKEASTGLPQFGALTLGEIANNGKDYLEFYNKTAVLGLLG